jgi:outer membrane protein assembly factor BamB
VIPLLACAPRLAPPPPLPPRVEIPDAPPGAPPLSWRGGWQPGPGPVARPVERWSTTLDAPVTKALSTDGARIYVVADGRVYALTLDGQRAWVAKVGATGAPEARDGGVVVRSGGDRVVLDAATGAVVSRGAAVDDSWRSGEPGTTWQVDRGRLTGPDAVAVDLPGVAVAAPTLDEERVYVAFGSREGAPGGVAACERDGSTAWVARTAYGPAAGLAVAEAVYVPDRDGRIYALSTEDGHVVWEAEGYGEFGTRPALWEGSLYAGNGDGSVYRIDRSDGGVVWKVPVGAAATGDPVVVGGLVVVGAANGRVVALGEP